MVPSADTLAADTPAATMVVDPSPRLTDGGRRSRKKQDTRDRLLLAADELFASRGYEATTTTDVADRADVAQRTLFRHFPSKEALLYADLEDAGLDLRTALAERPQGEPVVAMVQAALLSLGINDDENRDRRLLQAKLAATVPAVSGYFRAVVQASWERELIVAVSERIGVDPMADPRPEILAGAAMSACRVATRQWTATDGQSDYLGHLTVALGAIAELDRLQ